MKTLNIMKRITTFIFHLSTLNFFLAASVAAWGQEIVPLSYPAFMGRVIEGNLGYAAERINVGVAEAELAAARVFNDPTLSVELADNDDRRMQMGRSVTVELGKTFSPGKRSARIDLAASQRDLEAALLDDYLHTLRMDATLAYLEALKQAELYGVKREACNNIRLLAEGDSVRFALGKITEVDALQSRLEASVAHNELLEAEAALHNACAALAVWTGSFSRDSIYLPEGNLRLEPRLFDADILLQTALDNRADLAAALKNADVARKALKLVRRERAMDFDLTLGYNFNTEVRNEIAPAPPFNGLTLGVAIPLKFSNLNRAAIRAAGWRMEQAGMHHRQAEIEVQSSVMQSLRRYLAFEEQANSYDAGILQEAGTVVKGRIYSYERGETSLLEALNAQRTYNDVRSAYIETLFNCAASLVELERNAGIWDVEISN
jgi:cobalt-zinc-cadmium efflux system outer membrane protein